MRLHHFVSLFLTAMAMLALAAPVLAAPEPVVLRVFYSSNLQGEISPCG